MAPIRFFAGYCIRTIPIFFQIGKVKVGSEHRIALQTMTTTDTRDIEGTVAQVSKRMCSTGSTCQLSLTDCVAQPNSCMGR